MAQDTIQVLLIEDDPVDARVIDRMLRETANGQFVLREARSLSEGLEILHAHPNGTHVILLDLGLPDENGLRTLQRIAHLGEDLSIVVLTGQQNEELGPMALREGADDYLIKGEVDGRLLCRVLRYAVERHEMKTKLRGLSLRDDLTGLHNRKGFLLLIEQQMRICKRNQTSCLLIFCDLDGLKKINDSAGHEEGNRAILDAAEVLRASFRKCDILARFGGDEFVVLALGTSESSDVALRAHLSRKVDEFNAQSSREYRLSFSVGMVPCGMSDVPIEELLQQADALMYDEKKQKGMARMTA